MLEEQLKQLQSKNDNTQIILSATNTVMYLHRNINEMDSADLDDWQNQLVIMKQQVSAIGQSEIANNVQKAIDKVVEKRCSLNLIGGKSHVQ